MSLLFCDQTRGEGIPEANYAVGGGRRDHLAVGAGGQNADVREVIHRLADAWTVAELPDSGRSFVASCQDRPAIAAEDDRADRLGMW